MKTLLNILSIFVLLAIPFDAISEMNGEKSNMTGAHEGMIVKNPMQSDSVTRLSRIEVYPEYLEEYKKYAMEVGEKSLREEPGVLAMFAMADKEYPCEITILEIYSSQDDYKSHIASEHFQKYKQGTLHMVKSLELKDQTPLNPASRLNNYYTDTK